MPTIKIGRLGSVPRAVLTSALFLAMLCAGQTSNAQTVRGWALDRFEPNPAGDLFFVADFPWYSHTRRFALSLIGDYSRNPLVLLDSTGTSQRHIIENMFVLHAQGTLSILDRLDFDFSVPVSLLQTGEAAVGDQQPSLGAYDAPVTGDIRLGARGRLLGNADRDVISLHVGAYVFLGVIPYNGRVHNVTDQDIRARGFLTLAGHPGPVRWSLTAGYSYRPDSLINGRVAVGQEVFVNAALGFASPDGRLTVGPEAWASYPLFGGGDRTFAQNLSAEWLAGVHYLIADTILAGVGVGNGISSGIGTPEMRALVRLSYAPADPIPVGRLSILLAHDADDDGIVDVDDICPEVPQGRHPDTLRMGCPAPDGDNDGVEDARDVCPQIQAGDHPDPERAGCPEADTDQDGIYDSRDLCVTTAAGDHPDPERLGCPDGDDDSDGVLNQFDRCPAIHQGAHPDPSRTGCPLPDSDNDTVPDNIDHCPAQPGAPSTDPNRNGCPGLVLIERGQVRVVREVVFTPRQDRVPRESVPTLQAVADAMRASPQIQHVAIESHPDQNVAPVTRTSASAAEAENQARIVRAWLIEHGVEAHRLEVRQPTPEPVTPTNATVTSGPTSASTTGFNAGVATTAPAAVTATTGAPRTTTVATSGAATTTPNATTGATATSPTATTRAVVVTNGASTTTPVATTSAATTTPVATTGATTTTAVATTGVAATATRSSTTTSATVRPSTQLATRAVVPSPNRHMEFHIVEPPAPIAPSGNLPANSAINASTAAPNRINGTVVIPDRTATRVTAVDPAVRAANRDSDSDGVIDLHDLCVSVPAGSQPDPARPGCPAEDTDHDGVIDGADVCVTTPAGPNPDPARAGCPEADDDNDGIFNHADLCPTVHQGMHPDAARAGCPSSDRDNDTVPDNIDRCPDRPGAPSLDAARNGCPGLVRIEREVFYIREPVFFAPNRDRILRRSFAGLQAIVDAMRASPEIHRVAVEGYSDRTRNDTRDQALSETRAQGVMNWLIGHGADPARLEFHGHGSNNPIAPNTSPANRRRNRRVEFRIVDPALAPAVTPPPANPTGGPTFTPGAVRSSPAPVAPSSSAPASSSSPAPANRGQMIIE